MEIDFACYLGKAVYIGFKCNVILETCHVNGQP